MKLKALTFYANKMMTIRPNQIIEVDENMGTYLIKTFPDWFEVIEETKEESVSNSGVENKVIETPKRKRGRPKKE